MDPLTISVIAGLCTIGVGVLGKVLYTLRRNIKSCGCLQFRTPNNSENDSPRNRHHHNNNIEMVEIKPQPLNIQQHTPPPSPAGTRPFPMPAQYNQDTILADGRVLV